MSLSIPAELLQNTGLNAVFVAKFGLFFTSLLFGGVVCGRLLYRLMGLPVIAGTIIGGIVLGPTCIDIAHIPFFAQHLTMIEGATGTAYALLTSDLCVFCVLLLSSIFAVPYLLWLAGHETDIQELIQVGDVSITAGILGALLPIIIIGGVLYYGLFSYRMDIVEAMGMGLIFAATSVSIPVAMLYEAKKMHLKSSKALLGAAVVDDVVAVILLSLFFLAVQSGCFGACPGATISLMGNAHTQTLMASLIYLTVALFVLIGFGYSFVRPSVRWLVDNGYEYLLAPVATGVMLLYFGFAELFGGLAGITGAYFAGLFHRMGDKGHHAENVIAPFVRALLLPLFLGSIGLQVNLRLLRAADWLLVVLLLFLAIISKLLGCFIATGISNIMRRSSYTKSQERWSWQESYVFGAAMVARGEVGLVIATILHGARLITADRYVIAVVVIVLTTIATPILLAQGFSLLEARKNGVGKRV